MLTELSATQIEWLNCVKDRALSPENGWWVFVVSLPFQILFLVLGIECHAHLLIFIFLILINDTCLDVLLSYPCQASVIILFFLSL